MSTHTTVLPKPNVVSTGVANLALIGAGGISQSQHLPNLLRASRINLKYVCDLNEELLDIASARFPGNYALERSYSEILKDQNLDGVVIATSADSHVPLTLQALEAGKHVYVEKPLSETQGDAQRVVEAQKASSRIVAVGFNRRMAPAYTMAKTILKRHGGARNIHYRLSDAFWIWGKNLPAGSRMLHEVCHVFDILRFFTDSEVKSVYCIASRPDDETIVLQFENDTVASIMNTGHVHYDMPKEQLEIITKCGGIVVNDFAELRTFGLKEELPHVCFEGHTHPQRDQVHKYLFKAQGLQAVLDIRRAHYLAYTRHAELALCQGDSQEYEQLEAYLEHHSPHLNYMMDKGWQWALEHFADSILKGEACCLSGAMDGLRASQITQAAIQSRATGLPVSLSY